MIELTAIAAWRRYADEQRHAGRRVGLVPTMGALHAGHASLFRAARDHGDVVLATVFLNPRQFSRASDLADYPRTPRSDLALAMSNGVDCVVMPTTDEMWPSYPDASATIISVRGVADPLEGVDRPGHFDGVASVVAKLFNITGPCRAYFGEKDFQQIAVVRQLVRDLNFDVEVVASPTVRDEDGLALSSRNVLLDPDGRRRARCLSRALVAAAATFGTASEVRATLQRVLDDGGVDVAYVEVVDPATFVPCTDDDEGERRALVAALVDGVRLIDNASVMLRRKGG